MMPLIARRGRIAPLLFFVVALAVMVSAPVGVAWASTSTTLQARTAAASFTVSAEDLGGPTADPPAIKSPSAILINLGSGKVLYERKAHVRRPMASTTKIMTAVLVLEKMDLATPVTVSQKAAQTIEPKTWLKEGDVLTVEQLLYALMLRSANSAAVALAEAYSGSVEAFADEMNKKAAQLEMSDTHFVTPNGLDATGHYSTAADMALLGRYAMANEQFRKIVGTKTYTVSLPGRVEPTVFKNTNKLLSQVSWVTGIKSGLTPRAEQCLVGSGTKEGVSVISVVLGQPVPDVCWSESRALMQYGFTRYRHLTLVNEGVAVAESAAPYQLDGRIQLVTKSAVETELYREDAVTASVVLDRPLVLPVAAGEAFGRIVLTVRDETVGSVDLVVAKSFDKTTLGSKLTYYWDRFARWLGRIV